jgi:hypothetical protein
MVCTSQIILVASYIYMQIWWVTSDMLRNCLTEQPYKRTIIHNTTMTPRKKINRCIRFSEGIIFEYRVYH